MVIDLRRPELEALQAPGKMYIGLSIETTRLIIRYTSYLELAKPRARGGGCAGADQAIETERGRPEDRPVRRPAIHCWRMPRQRG